MKREVKGMHVTISYIIDTGNMESTSVSEPSLNLLFATSFYMTL